MIHLNQTVIVEGKYDKIRLKNFIDAEIITTDGFAIFKNKQKLNMIRRIAETRGILILTDSDSAGFVIRGHLTGAIDPKYITNVFVPEIKGKEKRKTEMSAQGLLGVEGLSEQVITDALKKAGIDLDGVAPISEKTDKITHTDLFELGLSGGADSKQRRKDLTDRLQLPSGMSTNQLLTALNSLYSKQELYSLFETEEQNEDR